MSGETQTNISGWTVDTLHALMQAMMEAQEKRLDERMTHQHNWAATLIEAGQRAIDKASAAQQAEWHEHLDQVRRETQSALDAHDKYVAEVDRRNAMQFVEGEKACLAAVQAGEKACLAMSDAIYKQLSADLSAAERATTVRADAAQREFHEHLEQNRHETDLAFISSEKAIAKAEVANEKRFESVNAFRAQLTDQATSFTPRTEFEGQVHALRTEQQTAAARNAERIQELADRMNRSEGKGVGLNAGWVYVLGFIAAVGTIVSLYLAFKGVA